MQITEIDIKNIIQGDQIAIKNLYKACYSFMMGISIRYQDSEMEAEDAMNRGFLKVIQNLKSYDRNRSFKNWLAKIIVNTNIDIYRSNKNHKALNVYVENYNGYEAKSVSIEMNSHSTFEYEEILSAIKRLTPMTQRVFNLSVIDGYKHQEIANMLSISVGTSKWHLSTGRKTLQKELEKLSIRKTHAV